MPHGHKYLSKRPSNRWINVSQCECLSKRNAPAATRYWRLGVSCFCAGIWVLGFELTGSTIKVGTIKTLHFKGSRFGPWLAIPKDESYEYRMMQLHFSVSPNNKHRNNDFAVKTKYGSPISSGDSEDTTLKMSMLGQYSVVTLPIVAHDKSF